MAQRNIFEMLGLEFDPPDNLKKIRAAYETWKKKLTSEQNTTVDPNRLEIIKSELAMENYITQVIENPRLRQHEAETLKQTRIEQLRLYIDIQRGDISGTLQVNQTQIRQIKEKLKLSTTTIEATYREQGFEIKKPRTDKKISDMLNNFFIADSVMNELKKNFADFQKVPDARNYSWSANVHDLYELAYYIEGQVENSADFYHRRDTEDLHEIFQNEAKKVSQPIPAWQSIKALLNLAQTQIFNSNDNRWKYDHSLMLEKLNDFFAKLKAAPEIFKRDKFFADNCINRIRKTFPNFLTYELSAALYNKVAGLLKEPYESTDNATENFFCVTCANCGAFENFRTREEAQRAVCKVCGENFYIDCPKCGKKVLANADHCTACDFSLSELKKYNYYIDYANSLLDLIERGAKSIDDDVKNVIAEVMKVFARAKLIKPDALDLKKIEWRINKINAEFKKRELIRWAESKMPSLSANPDKAVSDCMEILRRYKDYKPARERLKLIKPKKPLKISATIKENSSQPQQNSSSAAILSKISVNAKSTSITTTNYNLTATISWQPDNDLGVVYTVIKKADGVPRNFSDGEIIIEGTDKLEISDNNIKPGVLYGFAVFAQRLGAISDLATCTAVHYSDIEENKLIAKTEGGYCQFTWRLPSDNCLGVRILRSDSAGNSVVVDDCVHSPFVDKLVRNRKQYQYRLQCVYYSAEETLADREKFLAEADNESFNKVWKSNRTYKYSHGLTVTLTPEFPPRIVKNLNFNVINRHVSFNWQSTGEFDIWFKEISSDKKFPIAQEKKIFNLDKLDELLGSGVILKSEESSKQFCEFAMTGDIMKIAVISATKDLGIVNEIVTAANVEPCEIDEKKTQVDANGLKLVLKSLPKNLYLIHYKVQTEDSDELFAAVEDAKARHLNRIYATKYAQDTFISQSHLPQKELYITVIGEYKLSDGSIIYSAPSKMILNNRPKSVISYWLEWGTSGLFNKKAHAKNCKLIIESNAKEIPRMFLACRKDGRMNIELKDSSTQILDTVKEYRNGLPNGRLEVLLSDDIWHDISPGTVVKLLIQAEKAKFFDLKPVKPDSLTVPKK